MPDRRPQYVRARINDEGQVQVAIADIIAMALEGGTVGTEMLAQAITWMPASALVDVIAMMQREMFQGGLADDDGLRAMKHALELVIADGPDLIEQMQADDAENPPLTVDLSHLTFPDDPTTN